jgi:hypothetical protein
MARTTGNGHLREDIATAQRAAEAAGNALQDMIAELDATGAEIKGIDEGLVDFPAEREDRIVYLCWRLGEDTIAYWHELNAGFSGRQPL